MVIVPSKRIKDRRSVPVDFIFILYSRAPYYQEGLLNGSLGKSFTYTKTRYTSHSLPIYTMVQRYSKLLVDVGNIPETPGLPRWRLQCENTGDSGLRAARDSGLDILDLGSSLRQTGVSCRSPLQSMAEVCPETC
jgi:hypothetical protein